MPIITESMRRAAFAEMANPSGAYDVVTSDGRSPLAWILAGDQALMANNPLMRRTARDQEDPNLAPRGSEDPDDFANGPGEIDSDDLISFVQMCLNKLQGPELTAFVQKLASLLAVAESGNGVPDNNRQVLDGRRGASDRRPRSVPAQDSAIQAINRKGFLARHPGASRIDVWG